MAAKKSANKMRPEYITAIIGGVFTLIAAGMGIWKDNKEASSAINSNNITDSHNTTDSHNISDSHNYTDNSKHTTNIIQPKNDNSATEILKTKSNIMQLYSTCWEVRHAAMADNFKDNIEAIERVNTALKSEIRNPFLVANSGLASKWLGCLDNLNSYTLNYSELDDSIRFQKISQYRLRIYQTVSQVMDYCKDSMKTYGMEIPKL